MAIKKVQMYRSTITRELYNNKVTAKQAELRVRLNKLITKYNSAVAAMVFNDPEELIEICKHAIELDKDKSLTFLGI